MSKTYYVGNMPVSDELYHYGRKGMKWGKDIFSGDTPVQGGGGQVMKYQGGRVRITTSSNGNTRVSGTGNSAGRSAINKLKSSVSNSIGSLSKGAGKAREYVTGNQARSNLDRQIVREAVRNYNGAPNDNELNANFASGMAKVLRGTARDYFDSADSRKFYDLRGKAQDNVRGLKFEDSANKFQKVSDDYKKAQNQVNREYREEMRNEANKTAAAQREYDKTLAGAAEKTAKNVKEGVSSAAKSVGDFASKSAKSVGDWGGKQVNKGKDFISGIFGKKSTPASTPKPVTKPSQNDKKRTTK